MKEKAPGKFSQEAKEVFVSYRSLSIPEDKEAIITLFLDDDEGSLVSIDAQDIEWIISETEGFHYFLAELRGTWAGITLELSKWRELPECTECLLKFDGNPDTSLGEIEEAASSIQRLIRADANMIFSAGFAEGLCAGQAHVWAIFKMRDVLPESVPTGKDKAP